MIKTATDGNESRKESEEWEIEGTNIKLCQKITNGTGDSTVEKIENLLYDYDECKTKEREETNLGTELRTGIRGEMPELLAEYSVA